MIPVVLQSRIHLGLPGVFRKQWTRTCVLICGEKRSTSWSGITTTIEASQPKIKPIRVINCRPPINVWGGEYGPYQFEHFATGTGQSTTIYFTMSTWNPYTVILMKARLRRD